jgi:predicted esterase
VVQPRTLPHKQTFILLHGRGSSGQQFGTPLLMSPIPSINGAELTTLDQIFPHARFVFPTAARRRATVYRRAYTHQWFDNWKLDPPATDREELQSPGLHETTAYLHHLVRAEIALVPGGAPNIILGGLSQGCAASLTALLLWEGDSLGAVVGMCGWLPFSARLLEQVSGSSAECDEQDGFDPFGREDEDPRLDPPTRAVNWLRDEIELLASRPDAVDSPFQSIPVFLGHGTADDRVSISLGRDASRCLSGLGVDVRLNEYESLAHWYSGDMLRDLALFVQERASWVTPQPKTHTHNGHDDGDARVGEVQASDAPSTAP